MPLRPGAKTPEMKIQGDMPSSRRPWIKYALIVGLEIAIIACIILAASFSFLQGQDVATSSKSSKSLSSLTTPTRTRSQEPLSVEPPRSVSKLTGSPFYSQVLLAKAQPKLFIGGGYFLA
jgi:hypothetical protein